MDFTNDASKEISAKCLSTHQTQTTQLKKLSKNESSQHNRLTRSYHGQKFDVFLSHSGKQKLFVKQLYKDLTNQGVSCFFDQDRESLPVGEVFPPRIFEAVETCGLAVFLLSVDFLHSKWPMLELASCVKARDTNSSPEIIPLFYIISPGDLMQTTALNEKWKEIGIEEQQCVEWHKALKAIRPINGLNFSEGGDEVEFRDEIVREIWRKLPTALPRYHVPFMQGEQRMCQEVADFFKSKVHPNKKGIKIAGLYGIAGQGKTTVGKAFCNLILKDFEGKVCHLEFSGGDPFERAKLVLRYLIHCPQSHLQNLTKDQAQVELYRRVKGQRVLLVLDNITENSIDEVRDFIKADFGENSCILLSARSLDVLVKHCKIDARACMRVPSLEDDDAIGILFDRTSSEESALGAEDKAFALKCANRCSFKEISCDTDRRSRRFHPLALKAFGRYLLVKYGLTLSKWVAEIDGLGDPSGYGLNGVFTLLEKAFDDMKPKYRTIFMLLTIYIPPNMSFHNVLEWLAMSCNEEIKFIEEAVEDLCKKAFIEESEPEIRIHDLYFEFAQSKAKEMGRWLWWKGDECSTRGFISQDSAGFELAKLEGCMRRSPSEIAPKFLENLLVLQLVGVQNVNKLDLGRMESLRSITVDDCKVLSVLDGMENLLNLAWLQLRGLGKMLELPNLSSLIGLQHLEINITVSQRLNQLGDLTSCCRLKEIIVQCPSLLKFPRLRGLRHLEKVKFSVCYEVNGRLDCTECVELQSIVLVNCCKMAASPLLAGCKKLSEIVLSDCGAVTAFPDIDLPCSLKTVELQISSSTASAPKCLESCYSLENLRLLDMWELVKFPSFRSLSSLTVLEIGKCGIREPPDLSCCVMLEDVHFYTLKYLIRFPDFSLLRKLKKLNLCNCSRVRDPPDISGCHQLQLFYLQHNNNMSGLSNMHKCTHLEEVKVSWQCEDDEVKYEGIDPDSCEVDDDLEACLDCFKDVIIENLNGVSVPEVLKQWMQGKAMLAKKYFRGVKLYYSVTVPYESDTSSRRYMSRNPITLKSGGSKVFCSTLDSANEDNGWLNRVRLYFAERDIACTSAASGKKVDTSPSPSYHVKMLKTTIVNAFGDFKLGNFNPKVCHLKFFEDASVREKLALHYLTQFRNVRFDWKTKEDRSHYLFKRSMEGERVLLILDNITEKNIDKVRCYVGVELGEMSLILWTARSVDALHNSNVILRSFSRLQEEEVIAILMERTSGHTNFALKCANRCLFIEDRGFASTFHSRDCSDLSHWLARLNGYHGESGDHLDTVFAALNDAFALFDHERRLRKYFYHLEKWFAEINCVADKFAGLCWLAIKCTKEMKEMNRAWDKEIYILMDEMKSYAEGKLYSHINFKGRRINCVIMGKIAEMGYFTNIKELLQIINENYNEMEFSRTGVLSKWAAELDSLTDGTADHPRQFALKDDLEDGLDDHLDDVFRVVKNGLQDFDRIPRLRPYYNFICEWFGHRCKPDMMFVGLFWLAIKWEKEIESPTKEDIGRLSIKFKKEIAFIKAKMSSDEVVKWLLINCKKEINEKVEDINRIIRKEFVSTAKIREKKEECEILEAISLLIPLSPRYHVPSIQGETRMCQEVADFLSTVHFNEKGIRIAGLYGIPGLGKTTLAKAFCNFDFRTFDGKVCLLQFCRGNVLERQKLALRYLTHFPTPQLESVTSKDDARYILNTLVKGQRVLLVMDNITEDSIDEVRYYLGAELGTKSCIILIARSIEVLKNFNIDSQSCRHVPRFEEKEATNILLERMLAKKSSLGAKQRYYASKCANKCSFKEDRDSSPTFHPLTLKAFGRYLFSKHCSDLSKWVAEIDGLANGGGDGLDGISAVLDKAFNDMDPRYRIIFMVLAIHMPHNVSSDNVIKWAALNCYEEITYIKKAVEDLCEKAFIEEMEPEICTNDFIKEFAQMKKNYYNGAGEAKFTDKIVRTICCLLPQKYLIPTMHGEARVCQEVVHFFNAHVHPNEKGIRIAGLYGMPGLGKTTLSKAFCNLSFGNFHGNVYHLEFASRGPSMDRHKFKLLTKSLQGQRVLLVLDNIQSEESIDVVNDYLHADWGENSWILLSAQSNDVLKKFNNVQTCLSMPGLEEKEAITILLERTSLAESALGAKDRGFALQCANRCSFRETRCHIVGGVRTFHPLALKTFGRHLFNKYGSDFSKWVHELNGLDDMFTVLDKVFDDMDPKGKYHSIFMLLTVYMPPNMPPHKVKEWLAVNCNEEMDSIQKAVEHLWQKAFIEEIEPEIRIHDLYVEFAQSKARKMRRWLRCNRDLITSEAKRGLLSEGFELAKLEHCQPQDLCQIGDKCFKNLSALQVACSEMRSLGLNSMQNIRSLTLHNCEYLEVFQGIEYLACLAWLQIVNVPNLKVLYLSSLNALQYLEINTSGGPTELGDLTGCVSLTEIYVRCPSLWEFPRINGLPNLEKASFKSCEEVISPLDCRACVKLQSIALENCLQMAHIPLIDGCSNISEIVLNRCDRVMECLDEDESSALEILKLCISSEDASLPRHSECCDGLKDILLWNIVVSSPNVPSLRRFSNLTVLKLYNCDICEPPDVACCKMLEDVCFNTLKDLKSFPNFSSLWRLKKLCLYNCQRVRAPPHIGGCYQLQVFHLLYNDNMTALPKIHSFQALEEIKVSWHSEEVFGYYEHEDIEFCLDYQKDEIFSNINDIFIPVEFKAWQWMQSKRVRVKQYFRGQEVYYSITAPFESSNGSGPRKQASNADPLEQAIIQRASAISDEDELRFRDKAVEAIGRLIPPRIRFPYCSMQKPTTLNWLKKASTIKGIHVAKLYEVEGNEKTALRQSFYNFNNGFEGEISTLEFSEGNSMERLNNALHYLTCSPGFETALTTSEILEEGGFSEGPMFNIMILLIRYTIPHRFIDNNLMDIARDFYSNWGGNTRMVFHSQMYTIIELSRA